MILTPGNVFYFSGIFLVVLGNTIGVISGVLFILAGILLWRIEDLHHVEDDENEFANGAWAILHGAPWPGDPLQVFPDEASARNAVRGCGPECQLLVRGANEWHEVPRVTILKP